MYGRAYLWVLGWVLQLSDKLYSEWLPDERHKWRFEIEQGFWLEPYVLEQYRKNRESSLWRSTWEVEKLCEYVLFLEAELAKKTEVK
jgi:hypothetical protein